MGNFLAGIKGRLLAWAVVAAILIPCAMCGLAAANKPETYPGDSIAWRQCRDCSGKGCNSCDGKGSLWVITPGPSHPSWVLVRTHEASVAQPDPTHEKPEDMLKAIPGATGGVHLAFSREGKTVEGTSGFTGRARLRLAPGTWSYRAQRQGYAPVTGTLEVPPLTREIWKSRSPEDTLEAPLIVPMVRGKASP